MSSRFNDDYLTPESNNKYISLMKLKKLLNKLDTTSETNQQPIQPLQPQPLQPLQQQFQQPPMTMAYQAPAPVFGFQQPVQSIYPQNTMELSSNARMEIQNMIDRQAEITEKNMKEYVTLNSEKLVSYIKELLQYNQTVEKANRLREEETKKQTEAANTTNSILSVVPDSITSAFNKIKNAVSPNTTTSTTPPTQTNQPIIPTPVNNTTTQAPNNTTTQAPNNTTIQAANTTTPSNQPQQTQTIQPTEINTVANNNTSTPTSSSRLSLNNHTPTINTENNTIDEDLDVNTNTQTIKPPSNPSPLTTSVMTNNNTNTHNNNNNKPKDVYGSDPMAPKFDYNAAENELNEKKKQALAQEQLNRVNSEMENLGFMKSGMKGGMKYEEKQKKRSQKKNIKRKDKSKKKIRK